MRPSCEGAMSCGTFLFLRHRLHTGMWHVFLLRAVQLQFSATCHVPPTGTSQDAVQPIVTASVVHFLRLIRGWGVGGGGGGARPQNGQIIVKPEEVHNGSCDEWLNCILGGACGWHMTCRRKWQLNCTEQKHVPHTSVHTMTEEPKTCHMSSRPHMRASREGLA